MEMTRNFGVKKLQALVLVSGLFFLISDVQAVQDADSSAVQAMQDIASLVSNGSTESWQNVGGRTFEYEATDRALQEESKEAFDNQKKRKMNSDGEGGDRLEELLFSGSNDVVAAGDMVFRGAFKGQSEAPKPGLELTLRINPHPIEALLKLRKTLWGESFRKNPFRRIATSLCVGVAVLWATGARPTANIGSNGMMVGLIKNGSGIGIGLGHNVAI